MEKDRFLLLELTGLESPPAENDPFSVEIYREGAGKPSFSSLVRGKEFRDNYTIGLYLADGFLDPGRYRVLVIKGEGTPVFKSSMQVE